MKTIVIAALLSIVAPARAQTWAAIANFGIGEQFFNQGEYENALESFNAAWEALPTPVILYDLALTHYRLDNIYMAREYLRMFMKRISRSDPYMTRANHLSEALVAAISEDWNALGLDFACDYNPKTGVTRACGIARWPENIRQAWAAEVARATRTK